MKGKQKTMFVTKKKTECKDFMPKISALLITHCLLLSMFFTPMVNAQVGQQWVQRYNGPANDGDNTFTNSIAVDAAGNVYVTGLSSDNSTHCHYVTIKYNPSGDSVWVRNYYGPGNTIDVPHAIAVDAAGNVYVTGQSYGNGTGFDIATIKYNTNGDSLWVQRYNYGPINGWDGAYSIAVDVSGNVYVTGNSRGYGTSSNADYVTIKYNSSGIQQWVSRYDAGGDGDRAYSLGIDGSGNVYVTGISYASGAYDDYATVKYNSSGVEQWVQRYRGQHHISYDENTLIVDAAGNVYMSCASEGNGTWSDYVTIKYNTFGDSVWVQRYDGTAHNVDVPNAITLDAAGNVYVTGKSAGILGGVITGQDYTTIKYTSSGSQQWVSRHNGLVNGGDIAYAIVVDAAGNVYVTGEDIDSTWIHSNCTTVKYNSLGVEQWFQRYDGSGHLNDGGYSIAIDGSGNVIVAGATYETNTDIIIIKYSPLTGIEPVSNQTPNVFKLEQNYPNPFNPNTKIKFTLNKSSFAKLLVYDVLGKEVASLVNKNLSAGVYEVNFDGSKLASGIYYYKLIAGDFIDTKKMVMVK